MSRPVDRADVVLERRRVGGYSRRSTRLGKHCVNGRPRTGMTSGTSSRAMTAEGAASLGSQDETRRSARCAAPGECRHGVGEHEST